MNNIEKESYDAHLYIKKGLDGKDEALLLSEVKKLIKLIHECRDNKEMGSHKDSPSR